MSKHTKEPWKAFGKYAILTSTTATASFDDADDRDLALKCVTALAGLNPEAVVGVVEAATDALDEFDRCRIFSGCGDPFDVLRAAIAKLRTPTAAKPQAE